MERIKFIFFIFLLLISFALSLNAKVQYIITLKGGTKIKADSFIKTNGVIKVFKYGGYIIYPLKNVREIKKIIEPININVSKENKLDNKTKVNSCEPELKNIKSVPVYNGDNNSFDLKISGEIYNNCPKFLKNVFFIISFYSKDNKKLFTYKEFLDEIPSYEEKKFSKIIKCNDISRIKYFNYKLEFIKD